MRLRLATPPRFSFRRTALSHGWCGLTPFRTDEDGSFVETTVALPEGGAVRITLRPLGDTVELSTAGRPGAATRRFLESTARRMLNLDLDLEPYYERANSLPGYGWIAAAGSGRMLRCPTLFEDLVKLVLTTNCSWALTKGMVRRSAELAGEPAPDGSRAFPGPGALSRLGTRRLRDRVRTGYRAPLLAELARRVARGHVDPESWEDGRPVDELRREMLELPGVGPYVADNLLRLIGRPAGLGLDSMLRSKYGRLYHGGRRVTDRTIARRYARFGEWAGLALWCDMTRDWFGDEPGVASPRSAG